MRAVYATYDRFKEVVADIGIENITVQKIRQRIGGSNTKILNFITQYKLENEIKEEFQITENLKVAIAVNFKEYEKIALKEKEHVIEVLNEKNLEIMEINDSLEQSLDDLGEEACTMSHQIMESDEIIERLKTNLIEHKSNIDEQEKRIIELEFNNDILNQNNDKTIIEAEQLRKLNNSISKEKEQLKNDLINSKNKEVQQQKQIAELTHNSNILNQKIGKISIEVEQLIKSNDGINQKNEMLNEQLIKSTSEQLIYKAKYEQIHEFVEIMRNNEMRQ